MELIGTIKEIWRYPVRSVGGERLERADLSVTGLDGDRKYVLIDSKNNLPAAPERDKRWHKALHLYADSVEKSAAVTFPDGCRFEVGTVELSEKLNAFFEFPVSVAAYDVADPHLDLPITKHRFEHSPLHLVTTSSLTELAKLRDAEQVDSRRFRPSIVVETGIQNGFLEKQWVGHFLKIGTSTEIFAHEETSRCAITFLAQPGFEADPEILRTIVRSNKRHFGIYCHVIEAGVVAIGDQVFLGPLRS